METSQRLTREEAEALNGVFAREGTLPESGSYVAELVNNIQLRKTKTGKKMLQLSFRLVEDLAGNSAYGYDLGRLFMFPEGVTAKGASKAKGVEKDLLKIGLSFEAASAIVTAALETEVNEQSVQLVSNSSQISDENGLPISVKGIRFVAKFTKNAETGYVDIKTSRYTE